MCPCSGFSRLRAFCQARARVTPTSTWLPSMASAASLGHAEDKEYCLCFFSKITGERRAPFAEDWDPHQVSMREIASETKDKCFALFGVSKKFPRCGGAAEVGSDNYSLDTHIPSGRTSVFIMHFKVFSCTSSP